MGHHFCPGVSFECAALCDVHAFPVLLIGEKMANVTKVTDEKRAEFLDALMACGNVTKSAEATKISRQEWYREKDENEAFAKAWDEALKIGADGLEDEARRRAFEGVSEPVFYQGNVAGHVQKYSDTLLIVLLKAHKKELYGDKLEMTGKDGAPLVQPVVNVTLTQDGGD